MAWKQFCDMCGKEIREYQTMRITLSVRGMERGDLSDDRTSTFCCIQCLKHRVEMLLLEEMGEQ